MSVDLDRLAPELRGLLDRIDSPKDAEDFTAARRALGDLALAGDAEAQRLHLNVLCMMWRRGDLSDKSYAALALPTASLAAGRSLADAYNLAGLLVMQSRALRAEGHAEDADLNDVSAVLILDRLADDGLEEAGVTLANLWEGCSANVLKLAYEAREQARQLQKDEQDWEALLASLPDPTWRDRVAWWFDDLQGRLVNLRWRLADRIAEFRGGY